MNLYRAIFPSGSITYAARPSMALWWAAAFARWRGKELLAIREIRTLTHQLTLTGD